MVDNLELILSNIQNTNVDFVYIDKLYDDVEINLRSLMSNSNSHLVMDSMNSLIDLFKMHKSLLKSLQSSCRESRRQDIAEQGESSCQGDEHAEDRDKALNSIKLSFKSPLTEGGLDSIVGVEDAKEVLREACIFPLCFPHLFKGSVRPWRRILLYGPPGSGKTLLARGVAEELGMTMYCVTTAALFSPWIGESERVKTELLRHLDGISPGRSEEREPLILAATNCPWDIDPAFLRRFQRRIHVGLPDRCARKAILLRMLSAETSTLGSRDWETILDVTEGFSGADLSHVVSASLMIPIKELFNTCSKRTLGNQTLKPRPLVLKDFESAIQSTTKTVTAQMINQYNEFRLAK